jgi:hypothetical protein
VTAQQETTSTLVLACGALARELRHVVAANQLANVTVECLPAELHNRPASIPDAVEARLRARSGRYGRILIGYADCGTAGQLDRLCERWGAERLPGAHCYELFAGPEAFAELQAAEPGTFYLTDYLARHFERLVFGLLGIDRHPELLDLYFGNYRRVVYLAQRDDQELRRRARAAARRLGLHYEHRPTGHHRLEASVLTLTPSATRGRAA